MLICWYDSCGYGEAGYDHRKGGGDPGAHNAKHPRILMVMQGSFQRLIIPIAMINLIH